MHGVGIDFAKLLPAFMARQADDITFAEALSPLLRARAKQLQALGIADFLLDPAALSAGEASALLDSLAAFLGLEWWRADWDIATKREMMGKAEPLRRASESFWALQTILRAYFGDPSLEVEEWWAYSGIPYTFRILTTNAEAQQALRFRNVVSLICRQSQEFEGMWAGFSCRGVIYRGALGTDDTRLTGEAVLYRYLPAGTTVDGADGFAALSAILTAANPGQDVTDVLDDCFDYGTYTVTADLPLTFFEAGLPDWHAIPSTRAAGARLAAAMAAHWSDVGADVDAPSLAYKWPPSGGGGSVDLLTGLAHQWSFGDGATWDGASSVTADSVTLSKGTYWAADPSGIIGGCAVNSNANTPGTGVSSAVSGIGASNYTAAIWLRRASASTQAADTASIILAAATLGDQPGGGGWLGMGLSRDETTNQVPAFGYGYSSLAFAVKGAVALSNDAWHLLAVVVDAEAEDVILYADGEEVGRETAPAALLAGTAATTKCGLGRVGTSSGCARSLIGKMDELSIWEGRALSAADIAALWNGGAGLPFEDWT